MDAEINNVIYMELYLGAKMVDDKYLKTNNVRSIDRDSTVYSIEFKNHSIKIHTSKLCILLHLHHNFHQPFSYATSYLQYQSNMPSIQKRYDY
jgi:hypothetical protein